MPPLDTTPEAQKIWDNLWQNLSLQERFKKGLELTDLSHALLLAGFRSRYPDLSEEELKKKIIRQIYHVSIETIPGHEIGA